MCFAIRAPRTWVAVCRVRARSFFLLDQGEKEARLAAWGSGLASFAQHGSPVARLQWIERVALARNALNNQYGYFDAHRSEGPAVEPYERLLGTALDGALVHETYVVLQITAGSAGRQIRDAAREGGWSDDVGAFVVLWRQVEQLGLALDGLDVEPLSGVGINRLVRTQYEPFADDIGDFGDGPWPLATDVGWGSYRTGGSWHVTSWMSNLPRQVTNPAFLGMMLLDAGLEQPRTVSVTMSFTSPERAARRVERQQVTRESSDDWLAQQGFRIGARRREQAEQMNRRELELAAGHADVRWSGYVTVTGPTEATARDAHLAAANAARKAGGIHLRVLHGEQHTAFAAAALPTGTGRW